MFVSSFRNWPMTSRHRAPDESTSRINTSGRSFLTCSWACRLSTASPTSSRSGCRPISRLNPFSNDRLIACDHQTDHRIPSAPGVWTGREVLNVHFSMFMLLALGDPSIILQGHPPTSPVRTTSRPASRWSSWLEREPVHDPLILSLDPHVGHDARVLHVRRRPLDDRFRHAVPELVMRVAVLSQIGVLHQVGGNISL